MARRWQAKLAERGRDTELGTDLIFGFSFYLADTEAEAKAAGRPILEEYQKMFGPLGFAGKLTDEQLSRLAQPTTAPSAGLPTIDDAPWGLAVKHGEDRFARLMSGMIVNWHLSGRILELEKAYGLQTTPFAEKMHALFKDLNPSIER